MGLRDCKPLKTLFIAAQMNRIFQQIYNFQYKNKTFFSAILPEPKHNNDLFYQEFKALLDALEEKGYNHTSVAERIGVDKSTISTYYSDKKKDTNSPKKYKEYIDRIKKKFAKELGQSLEPAGEYESLKNVFEKKMEEMLKEIQDVKAGQKKLEKRLKINVIITRRRRRG
jgi:transposase